MTCILRNMAFILWPLKKFVCFYPCMRKLMMNQDKTVILQFFRQRNSGFVDAFRVAGAGIPLMPMVWNLGVLWDSWHDMNARVSLVWLATYWHISNISTVYRMLTREVAEILSAESDWVQRYQMLTLLINIHIHFYIYIDRYRCIHT